MQTKITDLTVAVLFGVGGLLAYLLFLKQINQFDCLKSMLKLLLSSMTSYPGSPFLFISQTFKAPWLKVMEGCLFRKLFGQA